MKFSLLISLYFILILNVSFIFSGKTFLDLAQNQIYSEEYNHEPDSLNPEYYTEKGQEQLSTCRVKFEANYNRCSTFKTCNFCDANSDCGWCDEKKICLPIDISSRNDQMIPLCVGDCQMIIKIEYCYKGLFEPANNPNEVNFSNYDQVMNFDLKTDPLNRSNLREKQQNSLSLDYKGDINLNGSEIDIQKEHNDMFKSMLESSKNIFYDLYNKNAKAETGDEQQQPLIEPDLDDEKGPDYAKFLKEYIPNFESPQFVKSDLEDYIDLVKKQKVKLWLKGYNLNTGEPKKGGGRDTLYHELPWLDEEKTRKEFLNDFLVKYMKDDPRNKEYYKNLYEQLNKSKQEEKKHNSNYEKGYNNQERNFKFFNKHVPKVNEKYNNSEEREGIEEKEDYNLHHQVSTNDNIRIHHPTENFSENHNNANNNNKRIESDRKYFSVHYNNTNQKDLKGILTTNNVSNKLKTNNHKRKKQEEDKMNKVINEEVYILI